MNDDSRRPPRRPDILHVDDQLLVINKPSGLYVNPRLDDTLGAPDLLRDRSEIAPDELFGVVNRLHEQASGAVVYARTEEAQRELARQFEQNEAQVAYLAFVNGFVEGDGEINLSLHYTKGADRLHASTRPGKSARTLYRVLERVAGNTLLECRPVGERYDQIRAHLAAIGHPLTVDPEYGGGLVVLLSEHKPSYRPSKRRPERPLVDRLTLHCSEISLIHPATKTPVKYEAPLPKDMRAVLTQLARL